RVALMMARSVRELTSADLGIGTTAGIGRGGIAVVSENREEVINSAVEADLRFSGAEEILRRQRSGIRCALELLESFLE
ncbi:MAG TPA: FeGP cofactor biosynthesis protein HcgF family protein, partial [Methanothermobacter thermautotrophicus]|nr:FeGP cofactor biosynthesis protein HcgF family protein [Methanothermobacter thermautotrophicus]